MGALVLGLCIEAPSLPRSVHADRLLIDLTEHRGFAQDLRRRAERGIDVVGSDRCALLAERNARAPGLLLHLTGGQGVAGVGVLLRQHRVVLGDLRVGLALLPLLVGLVCACDEGGRQEGDDGVTQRSSPYCPAQALACRSLMVR
ncbi:hypothetical protein FEO84_17915 [Stenotrophomonas maltophilia]|nr:hypothetical protein FEO84_17915 [Stenotrophomonas maltophilia]